jgi:hypothetical protein
MMGAILGRYAAVAKEEKRDPGCARQPKQMFAKIAILVRGSQEGAGRSDAWVEVEVVKRKRMGAL